MLPKESPFVFTRDVNRSDYRRVEFSINQTGTMKRNPTYERSQYDQIQATVYPKTSENNIRYFGTRAYDPMAHLEARFNPFIPEARVTKTQYPSYQSEFKHDVVFSHTHGTNSTKGNGVPQASMGYTPGTVLSYDKKKIYQPGDMWITSDNTAKHLETDVVLDDQYPKFYNALGLSYKSPYTGEMIEY